MHVIYSSPAIIPGAFLSLQMGIVVPLAVASLVLIVVVPAAARRGKLSVPIYALLALAAGAAAFGIGTLAGAQSVLGTPFGVVLSIIFFLLVAAGAGCFLGMLFYRHPADSQQATEASQDGTPPAGQPGP